MKLFDRDMRGYYNRTNISIALTLWPRTKEKELDPGNLGQTPKDLNNEHALSNVQGMLNWQNVNKFIFCTPW